MSLTTEEFIKRAKEIHGNKYDYSKVSYIKSKEKVCIICPEHGEFWQTPNSHLKGCGCKKCKDKNKGLSQKSNKNEFIKRAKEIHGNKYDYSKVNYINANTKVCIICPIHGEFWQTPNAHLLSGNGCKKCYGNYLHTTEEFIKRAKEIHGNKYDYSKVNYIGNHNKVCIICPIHGEFWQTPNSHLNGCGCRECSYKINKRIPSKSLEKFIEDANKKHNYKYDYSQVNYINNKTPICIICHNTDKYGKEHGIFWQRPDNHLHGQVCPKCAKKESKLERKIKDFLEKNNINFIQEKKFNWLNNQKLDFYLPYYNIAIECQGEQHFMPVDFANLGKDWANQNFLDIQKKDILKKKLCEKNNIQLIYFTTKELNNKFNKKYITDLRNLKLILKQYE